MKILIAGGTGFIGKHLIQAFLNRQDEVIVLTRKIPVIRQPEIQYEAYDGKNYPKNIGYVDVVINLAGAGIADHKWTESYKKEILESRIFSTKAAVQYIKQSNPQPKVFISASAVGYYGTQNPAILDEYAHPGSDFLAKVALEWEKASQGSGIRTVNPRIGIVMGKDGGAFPRMVTPFKLYAGGYIGSGTQGFPWIHIQDVVRAFLFLIDNEQLSGPVNLTAPDIVDNKTFGKYLATALDKPYGLPLPAFLLKMAMGESSMLLLEGQKVAPKKLLDSGFTFQFPKTEQAIRSLLNLPIHT
ncbi:MAG: TIGR01777 family oxidoreductase [Bacteroidia bacterium]|nr:TIGR01777 family oxidoreductase [Bacteroidia bacterium]